jgi:hypothetical protein
MKNNNYFVPLKCKIEQPTSEMKIGLRLAMVIDQIIGAHFMATSGTSNGDVQMLNSSYFSQFCISFDVN